MKIMYLLEENELYCKKCEYMMFYDWYNCTNTNFEDIENQDGLEIDKYWGFVRIYKADRYKICPFYKPIK